MNGAAPAPVPAGLWALLERSVLKPLQRITYISSGTAWQMLVAPYLELGKRVLTLDAGSLKPRRLPLPVPMLPPRPWPVPRTALRRRLPVRPTPPRMLPRTPWPRLPTPPLRR